MTEISASIPTPKIRHISKKKIPKLKKNSNGKKTARVIFSTYIHSINKWSPAEFEDMSEISASMPTPTNNIFLKRQLNSNGSGPFNPT